MYSKIWCDGKSWKFLETKHGLSERNAKQNERARGSVSDSFFFLSGEKQPDSFFVSGEKQPNSVGSALASLWSRRSCHDCRGRWCKSWSGYGQFGRLSFACMQARKIQNRWLQKSCPSARHFSHAYAVCRCHRSPLKGLEEGSWSHGASGWRSCRWILPVLYERMLM